MDTELDFWINYIKTGSKGCAQLATEDEYLFNPGSIKKIIPNVYKYDTNFFYRKNGKD